MGIMRNVAATFNAVSLMRTQWLKNLLDPRRDIDQECGHPDKLAIEDYKKAYKRGDVAARIVHLYPDECWCENPWIVETEDEHVTEFEKAFETLQRQNHVYSYLQHVDVLSGIGRFGVLLVGIDDGKDLKSPVEGMDETGKKIAGATERKLLYLRAFDEEAVKVKELETRISSPRYGMPLFYEIQFDNSDSDIASIATGVQVHWSRIVHVADNRINSIIYGCPRLERVFNRLLDLAKIAGGSAEMFWKGGFPGLSLEALPAADGTMIELDADATKEQMDAYMNGLQRYIATVGMQVKSLSTQVAEPRSSFETQIRLIAMALSVPWRILMGVEVGQLSSEQDMRAWNRRLNRRRQGYINPVIIRPFIQRMIAFGVLPEPKNGDFDVIWDDLNTPSDADRALVAEKQTNAITKYVETGSSTLMPPFHYLTIVMGLSDKEARSVIEAATTQLSDTDELSTELSDMVKEDAPAETSASTASTSSGE